MSFASINMSLPIRLAKNRITTASISGDFLIWSTDIPAVQSIDPSTRP
jgi:hypothetical protein